MENHEFEILLVEDNMNDAELAMWTLRKKQNCQQYCSFERWCPCTRFSFWKEAI